MANFLNGHSLDTGPVKKIIKTRYSRLHIVTHLCQFMGQNCVIWGVKKIRQRFLEAEPLDSKPRQMPPGCCIPLKMVPPYSSRYLPTYKRKTLWCPVAPSLRKHRLSEDPWFWPKYSNSPGVTIIDICQNWPHGALGDVSSCLETKFDKEMSMGSVPNCRKEIANRYSIRWFKCKLKPPKNPRLQHTATSKDKFVSILNASMYSHNYQLSKSHYCSTNEAHQAQLYIVPSNSLL